MFIPTNKGIARYICRHLSFAVQITNEIRERTMKFAFLQGKRRRDSWKHGGKKCFSRYYRMFVQYKTFILHQPFSKRHSLFPWFSLLSSLHLQMTRNVMLQVKSSIDLECELEANRYCTNYSSLEIKILWYPKLLLYWVTDCM